MTALTDTEMRAIAEALRREVYSGLRTIGGATLGSDGSYKSWGGEKIMVLANPDGPKAADAILALLDAKAKAEARVVALNKPTPEMWEAAWSASQDHFVGDDISKRGLELALKAFVRAVLATPDVGEAT